VTQKPQNSKSLLYVSRSLSLPHSQSPALSIFHLLLVSRSLSDPPSLSLRPPLSVLPPLSLLPCLSVPLSQCRSLSVSTLSLSTLSLCPLSLSALSLSFTVAFAKVVVCVLRLSKRFVFYFVFVWKACKGCSFKWLLMLKDVFFMFIEWFGVKFWFLWEFWWKRKSFWSFHCSVLALKRFLRLGFDFFWFWSKVYSFMSFTWSFLVLGGEKNVFCKCFKWFFMKNDVFVCLSFNFHVKFVFLYTFAWIWCCILCYIHQTVRDIFCWHGLYRCIRVDLCHSSHR